MADDLYRQPRKGKSSKWWKWAPVIILASFFVYRSTRSTLRLHSDPPPLFYDYSTKWTAAERVYHRRLADAYWQVAIRRIQSHYSPNRPLPPAPPPQFRISSVTGSQDSDVATTRIHYWHRLRIVWNHSVSWNVSYGWNTAWVQTTANSFPQYIPQWVSSIFQNVIVFFDGIIQRIPFS